MESAGLSAGIADGTGVDAAASGSGGRRIAPDSRGSAPAPGRRRRTTMTDHPDLTAELDAAEDIVTGRVESVVTEWGSLDSLGRLFAYGHDEFVARSVVAARERYGLHD